MCTMKNDSYWHRFVMIRWW